MLCVSFVAVWAYGTGGVPRAVFAVAGELARRGHDVEVVSVYRTAPAPYTEVDPRVRVRWLEDLVDPATGGSRPRARRDPARAPGDRRLDRLPSDLARDAYPSMSRLTDRHLERLFEAMDSRIVVATRPELAVAAARWTPPDVAVVAAEHQTARVRPDGVREALVGLGSRLDGLVLLTEADRDAWLRAMGEDLPGRVEVIPNAPTFALGPPAPLDVRVVVAAGRLTSQKAFDRLVDAYAPIATAHPDWQLHIYGRGHDEADLRAQIARLGLGEHVRLLGFTDQLEQRLAEASIFAMSSRYEGFPMVLLEAMTKGVPPVSVNCPEGPRQLIRDGVNGLLVGRADVAGLTAAMLRLIEDAGLRRRLGRGALATAGQYTLPVVVDAWERLLGGLATGSP